jgi:16S rRNA (cytidine1402-2'-O)-methyltransferase
VVAALANGFPVVPVPGPALPLTALVISGLPADTFCYVGELPGQAKARHDLIQALVGERRTLLFLVRAVDAAPALGELCTALGDRPLVVVSAGSAGQASPWRGTLQAACEEAAGLPVGDVHALVVGGATEEPAAWDEARLAAAIDRRAARGEGAKEISQALAGVSRWSRREIYRRAIEQTGTRPDR